MLTRGGKRCRDQDECTFLSPFYSLSGMDFDMVSHEQANVKGSLHKNLQHWHHLGENPSVIDTIENG